MDSGHETTYESTHHSARTGSSGPPRSDLTDARAVGTGRRWGHAVGALALMWVAAACADQPTAVVSDDVVLEVAAAPWGGNALPDHLKLMTRNLYLGGDVAPVLGVDFSDLQAVTDAAVTVWTSVQANDFASRANALADEIAATRPHVVGLQEASRFITLNAGFQQTGVLDYLQMLQAALTARGVQYTEIIQGNTSVTMPIALQAGVPTAYLKFTDRDVTLVRSDVPVLDVQQGNYQAKLDLAPGVTLKRG